MGYLADAGVAIEYRVPQSPRPVGLILKAIDERDQATAVIVELNPRLKLNNNPRLGAVSIMLYSHT